ncbi:hypothetical protein COU57_05805 [Candidatus Pacearchaeota archaeon CG10_big_fil_rev_8_21_14_0_10_32_14]|nr:MAG: hypothetical protein COU57_05805 [Candidatus Pacearchaeota archaeon CG10_big_fil_rev_8_21_14_0_10_32_14]
MSTTIQISGRTLQLLKKIKAELDVSSYDEAIVKMATEKSSKKSLAGFLGKMPKEKMLKDIREEHDRY